MIGERIAELRKEKNISQGRLADAVGVSRQAVSKWENGQATPDTSKMILLAEALETEVEYLATGVKPVYESPPVIVNVVEKVDQVVEKVVVKEVVRHVPRKPVKRNPLDAVLFGVFCFLAGVLVGLIL